MLLTAADTYTGATTIGGGILTLFSNVAAIAQSSGVNLAAGATFDVSAASNPVINGLTGVAGSAVNLSRNTLAINQTGTSTFSGQFGGTAEARYSCKAAAPRC